MNLIAFHLPLWAIPFACGAAFALGIGAGTLYFASLWRTTRVYTAGGGVFGIVGAALLRLMLLGMLLATITLAGALPLLSAGAGILVARHLALRRAEGEPI